MLYREIIAVCSQIHPEHINTLCGQNAELLNVKPGGIYSDHCVVHIVTTVLYIQWPLEFTFTYEPAVSHLQNINGFSTLQTEAADIPETLLRGILSACKAMYFRSQLIPIRCAVRTSYCRVDVWWGDLVLSDELNWFGSAFKCPRLIPTLHRLVSAVGRCQPAISWPSYATNSRPASFWLRWLEHQLQLLADSWTPC